MFGKLEYLDKAAGAGGWGWGWLHYLKTCQWQIPSFPLFGINPQTDFKENPHLRRKKISEIKSRSDLNIILDHTNV